jgi:hypothetical protein
MSGGEFPRFVIKLVNDRIAVYCPQNQVRLMLRSGTFARIGEL